MVTGSTHGVPVHPKAWAAIVTAVLAGVLALYGSMHAEKHIAGSPLRDARGEQRLQVPTDKPLAEYVRARSAEETARSPVARPFRWAVRLWYVAVASAEWADGRVQAVTARSKIVNYSLQIVAYVLPFVLGVGAGLAGGSAMNAVQRSGGRYVGNTLAVQAMLVGGLAAVVAGCMMVTLYVWPRLPSMYTT